MLTKHVCAFCELKLLGPFPTFEIISSSNKKNGFTAILRLFAISKKYCLFYYFQKIQKQEEVSISSSKMYIHKRSNDIAFTAICHNCLLQVKI